ncbi:RNase P modulator RnpM [Mesoplasma melaleucae]|uniref:RNA-binding protein n=1 Tax=Mesoplasma melaleucae TaxID=81459 RepID=A0A2K8NZB9_9MOLU|nr:YlxR family protein [Mesoplasma melaleucae]ATZ17973.1 RNA-binding protein [Mesoplasma melaleucae]
MIKTNLRRDVVSKEMLDKSALIRVVLNKKNEVFIDLTYQADGRGVYIKKNLNSIKIAKQKNLFSRGLKTKVDPVIYDELEKLFNEQN